MLIISFLFDFASRRFYVGIIIKRKTSSRSRPIIAVVIKNHYNISCRYTHVSNFLWVALNHIYYIQNKNTYISWRSLKLRHYKNKLKSNSSFLNDNPAHIKYLIRKYNNALPGFPWLDDIVFINSPSQGKQILVILKTHLCWLVRRLLHYEIRCFISTYSYLKTINYIFRAKISEFQIAFIIWTLANTHKLYNLMFVKVVSMRI